MILKLQVTKTILDRAKPADVNECPLVLALAPKLKEGVFSYSSGKNLYLAFDDESMKSVKSWPIPEIIHRRLLYKFDRGESIKPFFFELEVTEEELKLYFKKGTK